MQTNKQQFNLFLERSPKSDRYNDLPVNDPIPSFCEISFDGEITISEMLSSPIFNKSSQGNESIFKRYLQSVIPNTHWIDFNDVLNEIYKFHADYLLSNRLKHTFFNERIFINLSYVGIPLEQRNIQFHTVKFQVFDEDDFNTSFSVRSFIASNIKELLDLLKKEKQIELHKKSIFC